MAGAVLVKTAWVPTWHGHRRAALGLTLVACVVGVALLATGEVPIGVQLLVLAVGVSLVGIPHGALDGRLGERWLRPRLGRAWAAWFTVGYLALAAAVVAAWVVAPTAALIGFLVISAFHFGLGDVEPAVASWPARVVEGVTRGTFVLALPALFHREEVATLFTWLLPAANADGAGVVAAGLAAAAWVAMPAAVVVAARHGSKIAAELALLALAFATLPPLLGFGVYFCVWHAPRHLLDWLADDEWRALARAALPATLATLAGMGVAAWLLVALADATTVSAAATRSLFVGLSALTVPHMLLEHLAARPSSDK